MSKKRGSSKRAGESGTGRSVSSRASPDARYDDIRRPAFRFATVVQVAAVFIFAFILRIVYVQQLSHTYFFAPFRGGYDDYIFDRWALEILQGNWIGDPVIYIYRMPLYVYFLSLMYYLFGHSYWVVYIAQSLLGAATCVLVYGIGRALFSPAVGVIAGILTALYGPFLFYGGMLVGETLGIALTCLAFLSLVFFQRTKKARHLFPAGIFVGLSMLARGNMLIVLPFIAAWVLFACRGDSPRKIAGGLAALFVGIAIAVAPVIIRNYAQDKDIVPITALGGLNIYIGNSFDADGRYRVVSRISNNAETMIRDSIDVAERETGKKLKPSGVSNFWLRETLASLKEHGIGYLFPLMLRKFVLIWNAYELPDIWDYYFLRQYIPLMRLPLIGFSVLVALACAGAYLSWSRRRDLSILYAFMIGYIASLIAVFVTSRYRMQIVPFLAILSAYTIVRIKDVRTMKTSKVVVSGFIMLLSFIFSNISIERTSFETSFNSLAILLKRAGRIDDAINTYNRAIAIAPHYPSPYYNLGILYRDSGNAELAIKMFKKAIEIAPDFRQAIERLNEMQE